MENEFLSQRAKGYQKLGNKETSRKLLEELLLKSPEDKDAQKMLSELKK